MAPSQGQGFRTSHFAQFCKKVINLKLQFIGKKNIYQQQVPPCEEQLTYHLKVSLGPFSSLAKSFKRVVPLFNANTDGQACLVVPFNQGGCYLPHLLSSTRALLGK